MDRKKLNDRELLQLVYLYRKHECLWKPSHPDYKKRPKRIQSYQAIKNRMSFRSVEEVKKKIKSLRDTYTSEKGKIKRAQIAASTGNGAVYETKLFWFKAIDAFLSGCGEGEPSEPSDTDHLIFEEIHMKSEIDVTDDNNHTGIHSSNEDNGQFSPDAEREDSLSEFVMIKPRKRRVARELEDVPVQTSNVCSKCDSRSSAPPTADEFYYFALSLASQLRELPTLKAMILQQKMQKMVLDARIQVEKRRVRIVEKSRDNTIVSHSEEEHKGQIICSSINNDFSEETI